MMLTEYNLLNPLVPSLIHLWNRLARWFILSLPLSVLHSCNQVPPHLESGDFRKRPTIICPHSVYSFSLSRSRSRSLFLSRKMPKILLSGSLKGSQRILSIWKGICIHPPSHAQKISTSIHHEWFMETSLHRSVI